MDSNRIFEALDALGQESFSGSAFRHVAQDRHPLSGAGARTMGGRWNPRNSFSTLYLGLSREVVELEFARMAEKQGRDPQDFLPRSFVEYDVRLGKIVDLRLPETRESIGLPPAQVSELPISDCQAVGEASQHLGFEGILAPSAAGDGLVLAVFMDRLAGESRIDVVKTEVISGLV